MPRPISPSPLLVLGLLACGGPEPPPEVGADAQAVQFLPGPRPGTWRWFGVEDPARPAGARGLGAEIATDGDVMIARAGFRVEVYRRAYAPDTSQGWPWTYRTEWRHEQTLSRGARMDGDWGANIDVLGDWIAVGARQNTNAGEGYVELFRYRNGAWSLHQRIWKSSLDTTNFRDRCCQVKLTEDRLLVGDSDHISGKGAVFVLRRQITGYYVQAETLLRPDAPPAGVIDWHFGRHFEVDGPQLVVSSIRSIGTLPNRVYVYRHDGSSYALEQTLDAPAGEGDGGFGYRVGIAGDRLAIIQTNSESLLFYERRFGLFPAQPSGRFTPAEFPSDFAFDGHRVVVARSNTGAADAYTRTGVGDYTWQERLQIPPGSGGATSLLAMDIGADHLVLGGQAHGLIYIDGDRTGALRAFRWHNGLCPLVSGAYRCP